MTGVSRGDDVDGRRGRPRRAARGPRRPPPRPGRRSSIRAPGSSPASIASWTLMAWSASRVAGDRDRALGADEERPDARGVVVEDGRPARRPACPGRSRPARSTSSRCPPVVGARSAAPATVASARRLPSVRSMVTTRSPSRTAVSRWPLASTIIVRAARTELAQPVGRRDRWPGRLRRGRRRAPGSRRPTGRRPGRR